MLNLITSKKTTPVLISIALTLLFIGTIYNSNVSLWLLLSAVLIGVVGIVIFSFWLCKQIFGT